MTVEVQLQVANLDLRDPSVQDIICELPNYAWATTSGLTTMTVYSDGDVVADATTAIRCARSHGIDVLRVLQERVTYGEIARRIGDFSREAVRKWTKHDSFPTPRQATSNNARGVDQEWDWAEVLVWLKEEKGLDLEENLPTETQTVEIDAFIQGLDVHTSTGAWQRILQAPSTTPSNAPSGFVVVFREQETVLSISTSKWNRVAPKVRHLPEAKEVSKLDYA